MPNYWYDHVHLASPDPLKTAEFYEKMFGATRTGVRDLPDGRISVMLEIKGSRLLVMERTAPPESEPVPPGTGIGLDHFGLGTDDIEAAVEELKAKGVTFKEEVRVVNPELKIAFLWAPNNALIELLERK